MIYLSFNVLFALPLTEESALKPRFIFIKQSLGRFTTSVVGVTKVSPLHQNVKSQQRCKMGVLKYVLSD